MAMTLQEVEALPSGCKVLVDGVEWERTEKGLLKDGIDLGLMHFTGYLADGRVNPGMMWQIGRWYRNGDSWALITHRAEGRMHGLSFGAASPDPSFPSWLETESPGAWRIVAEDAEDPWMRRAQALYRDLSEQVPERLVEALHGYADAAGDAEFDDLLDEHGIGRGREHTSRVRITGHSYWTPSFDEARAWLGDEFTVSDLDDSITVYWERDVEIVNTGVGCLCDTVERSQVQQYVPVTTDDFSFDIECA